MWSNFFMQEEEQRIGARGRGSRGPAMSDAQEGKIKLAFFIAIAGVTLTVLAVGTEFWVEMNTFKQNHSMTCEAAHFGLWKFCYKKLWVDDVDELRATCGPAELPGDFKRISRLIIKNVLVDRRIAQQENLEAKKESTNFIAKGIRFAIPSSGLNMSAKRLLAKIHVDYYAVGKGQKENLTQDSLTKTRRPSKF